MLRQLLDHVTGFFLPRTRSVVVSERRQLVRVRCHLPMLVKYKEHSFSGVVLDMGSQGLRIRLDTTLPVGAQFAMRATLSGHARVPFVNFHVLWNKPKGDKNIILHGAAYDETEANLKRSWVGLLFRELGLSEKHTASRRKYLRVDGRIPLKFVADPTQLDKPPQVEMVNLGVGGVLIRCKQPLIVGLKAQIILGPFEGLPPAGPYTVEVISTKPDETGLYCLAALRFSSIDNQLLQNVGRYVVKLLRV